MLSLRFRIIASAALGTWVSANKVATIRPSHLRRVIFGPSKCRLNGPFSGYLYGPKPLNSKQALPRLAATLGLPHLARLWPAYLDLMRHGPLMASLVFSNEKA